MPNTTAYLGSYYYSNNFSGVLSNNGSELKNLNENYRMLFPALFMYDHFSSIRTDDRMINVTEKIREFYFNSQPIRNDTLDQLINVRINSKHQ